MKTRTRYAPSPTGRFHIGGARTALFCYLLAKNKGGDFLFRLEDTDIEREVAGGEANQLNGLNWLGAKPDYFPGHEFPEFGKFRQSERLEIYDKYAKQVLEQGKAYKCDCQFNAEIPFGPNNPAPCGTLIINSDGTTYKQERKCKHRQNEITSDYTVRMEMPDNIHLHWVDGVRGEMNFNTTSQGDWVMIKSNGIPTYNFANVIDDHLMQITDILRGEEHLSNTPKQVYTYKLFGWVPPTFNHLTIITNMEGKKLSKRDETTFQFIENYKDAGYLPHAVFNFLALLGWSPKSDKEILSKDELISLFKISEVSKAPTKFDQEKMKWVNNQYIKLLSFEELFTFLKPFLTEKHLHNPRIKDMLTLFQPGLREGREITNLVEIFFQEHIHFDEEQKAIIHGKENLFHSIKNVLQNISHWNSEEISKALKGYMTEHNMKVKDLMQPLRIKVTAHTHGPELAKVFEIFGKDKVLNRLN